MQDVSPQLDIIYRMMAAFASTSDISETLYEGLEFVSEQIGAEAASFFYLHEERETLICEACIGPIDITGLEVPAGAGIVGAVTQSDTMRYVHDTASDEDFTGSVDAKTGFETKSMICVPVSGNGKRYGAMQFINRLDGDFFSDNDATLVSVYGKSAALALANSQMAQRMVEADSFARDLRMASKVQESLFPEAQYDYVHGINIPKKGVSGDLYDYVTRGPHLYFCMADVSGKGTDAALVMAKTISLFRAMSREEPEIGHMAARINAELVETAFNGMFVTAIMGRYDPLSGDMQCCNAGHEPGLLLNLDGTANYVEASIQPLGILDFEAGDISVETHNLTDSRFFCYSDGITEAAVNGVMLGADKLATILAEQMDIPIASQIDNTVQAVKRKVELLPDDLTLLGLGCAPMARAVRPPEPENIAAQAKDERLLFSLSIINEVPELRRLRREIEEVLNASAARHIASNVCLAVDEAAQNVIRHAFPDDMSGRIDIRGHIEEALLHVVVTDSAPLIDLASIKPRDLDDVREGGLGTYFIREITETSKWSHDDGQNRLDMKFRL